VNRLTSAVVVGRVDYGGRCILGSLEGGCDPGFPGSKLLSSNLDFVCGKPLHAIRGKGSHLSVGQELNLLGHGRVLPFNRCMLGVPVGVPTGLALRRSVSSHSATFGAHVWNCLSRACFAITCNPHSAEPVVPDRTGARSLVFRSYISPCGTDA
jgi:hypothetical protein